MGKSERERFIGNLIIIGPVFCLAFLWIPLI